MGLKVLKCPKCGQSNLIQEEEHYRCPTCESIIFDDEYKTYAETMEKLIEEGKEADIGALRHSLNIEIEQEHINIENIKAICRQIKAILPEDVIASFYLTFVERKNYPRNYEVFLKELTQEKTNNYEINQLIPIIIKSCDIRTKEVIEELLKSHNLYNQENKEKINQVLQEREQELERYDTEKDVFICHSSKDKEEIIKIVNVLEDNNISCWYSGRNLPWDIENYWEGIHKAIKDCKVFLFVLSKYSRVSKDVVHELDYARSLNKEIRVEYRIDGSENNVPIKKCFDGIQWIDGSTVSKYEELTEKIYNYLENYETAEINSNFGKTNDIQEQNKRSYEYNEIRAMLNCEKYEEALEEIEKEMRNHPNDVHLLELMLEAHLYGRKAKNSKALRTFELLIKNVDSQHKQKLEKKYSFLLEDSKEKELEETYQPIQPSNNVQSSTNTTNKQKEQHLDNTTKVEFVAHYKFSKIALLITMCLSMILESGLLYLLIKINHPWYMIISSLAISLIVSTLSAYFNGYQNKKFKNNNKIYTIYYLLMLIVTIVLGKIILNSNIVLIGLLIIIRIIGYTQQKFVLSICSIVLMSFSVILPIILTNEWFPMLLNKSIWNALWFVFLIGVIMVLPFVFSSVIDKKINQRYSLSFIFENTEKGLQSFVVIGVICFINLFVLKTIFVVNVVFNFWIILFLILLFAINVLVLFIGIIVLNFVYDTLK